MRTTFQSCALLSTFAIFLTGCETSVPRSKPASLPLISQHWDSTTLSSADDAVKLSNSFKRVGAHRDAFAVLAEAHRRFPANVELLSAYGRQAAAIGQDEIAVRLLERALRADPSDWRALSALAVLKGRKGNHDAARSELVKARHLSNDDPGVLNNLGMNDLLGGRPKEAAIWFRKALTSPDLDQAHTVKLKQNLAVAQAVTGEFDLADRLAGKRLPRRLKYANSSEIAAFMGISDFRPVQGSPGWGARLADASDVFADPLR